MKVTILFDLTEKLRYYCDFRALTVQHVEEIDNNFVVFFFLNYRQQLATKQPPFVK